MKKLLCVLLIIMPIFVFCQVPDPLPNTYINDLTGTLNADQIHSINETVLGIEKKFSVQIVIVLIDRLPDNLNIEQYSLEVGRKWHVGNAANGLVYVAALSQHKQRLEVARNLEYQITDISALQITDAIKPFFRSGNYYGGINQLLRGINEKINPVLAEQVALGKEELQKKEDNQSEWPYIISLFLLGAAISFIIVAVSKRKKINNPPISDAVNDDSESEGTILPSALIIGGSVGLLSGLALSNVARKRVSDDDFYNKTGTPVDNSSTPTYFPSYTSSSDSGSSSSSNNDSSYGNWGSGSSDSGSSSYDSGYSGGGASNDW